MTRRDKGLQRVTKDYRNFFLTRTFQDTFSWSIFTIYDMGIHGVTRSYRGLQGVTRGYKELQGVTRGYKGLQGVTRGDRG